MIDIDDEEITVPQDKRELEIEFTHNSHIRDTYFGIIAWHYLERSSPKGYSYGALYISSDFNQLSIAKYAYEYLEDGSIRGSWRAHNGLMVTAPAQSREVGIDIFI